MVIINDFQAIATRMRKLRRPAVKDIDLEYWRSLAAETARACVEGRRKGLAADIHGSARQLTPRPGR